MQNPRSLVFALHAHWSVVEWLVQRSREQPVFEQDQVVALIGKVDPSKTPEDREGILRALINADILQLLPRDSLLQLNAHVLEFVRGLTREHELGLSAVLQARVQGIRETTERLNEAFWSGATLTCFVRQPRSSPNYSARSACSLIRIGMPFWKSPKKPRPTIARCPPSAAIGRYCKPTMNILSQWLQ